MAKRSARRKSAASAETAAAMNVGWVVALWIIYQIYSVSVCHSTTIPQRLFTASVCLSVCLSDVWSLACLCTYTLSGWSGCVLGPGLHVQPETNIAIFVSGSTTSKQTMQTKPIYRTQQQHTRIKSMKLIESNAALNCESDYHYSCRCIRGFRAIQLLNKLQHAPLHVPIPSWLSVTHDVDGREFIAFRSQRVTTARVTNHIWQNFGPNCWI